MTDAKNMRSYLNLFEAEDTSYTGKMTHPDISYKADMKGGQVTKVTAFLKSYESGRFTKLGRNLLEVEQLEKRVKELKEDTKQEARDLLADLFHAEDAACTRVVDTVGFLFEMSKNPKPTETVKYSKVLEELEVMMPELKDVLSTLIAKHTSAPVQKTASLKATDKAPKTEESISEGFGDKLKGFFGKLKAWVDSWGAKYDSKLDALKREVGMSESIEEGWAEDQQAFYASIATAMREPLDDNLIQAIEASAITQDEWKQDPFQCKQRIRGAQEEMGGF
jgi:hypothetical protein